MSEQMHNRFSTNQLINTSMTVATTFFGETSLVSYTDGDTLLGAIWNSDAKFATEDYISPVPFLSIHLENPVILRNKSPDRTVEEKSYPGNLCLTPSGIHHSFSWDSRATLMILFLSQECIDSVTADFTRRDPAHVEIPSQFNFQDPWLQATSYQIYAEIQADLLYGRTYLDSLSRAVTAHILRFYSTLGRPAALTTQLTEKLTSKQLQRINDYIQDHLSHDKALLVEKLADVVALPASRFCRSFRASTGMRPHEYIIHIRLKRAKAMLIEKNRRLSLSMIASQTGFADQAHMTRLFKKQLGITPAQLQRGEAFKSINGND